MQKKHPFPVTPENFTQCWEFIDRNRRIGRRQTIIAKLGGFIVNLIFLLSVILCGCGLLHQPSGGPFSSFLETLFFFPLWQRISAALLTPTMDLAAKIGTLLGISYGFSLLIFAALAVLVWLLYHPLKKQLPTGTYEENTALLAEQAQICRDYSYKTRLSTSVVATVLTVFAVFLLFIAYVMYSPDPVAVLGLLSVFPTQDLGSNCILYVILLYLFSNLISSVLLFLARPIYRYSFPYELVIQAQRGAIMAKDADDASLAEEALESKNAETAAQIREEAIALEKEAAYSKAQKMFFEAAVRGDVPAMEQYARHCLLSRMNDSARYWLKNCVASAEASKTAKRMLLRLRLGLRHNCRYLRPDEAPPTTGQKIKTVLATVIKILWRMLVVAFFIVAVVVIVALFKSSTDPNAEVEIPTSLSQLWDMFKRDPNSSSLFPNNNIPVESVSPFETPSMTLTAEGAQWCENCVAYDTNGNPVIFCYGKDLGGDLTIPLDLGPNGMLYNAGIYTGNIWDIRSMGLSATYLPQTKTVVISQDYLMNLEAGEYFIVFNNSSYAPLLISDTTAYNSTQRGIAACGNEAGKIINDLLNPQDITLSFYNLGDNTIRSLTEVRPMATNSVKTPVDSQYYTISEDCRSVTILAAYWQQQATGSFVTFEVRLANGDSLDMGHIHVGTVEGNDTGLMELAGPAFYSVSAGGDLIITYSDLGTPTALSIYSDNRSDFVLDSNFIDFDSCTITIPADVLKDRLTPGESLYINLSYKTTHDQTAYADLSIQIGW